MEDQFKDIRPYNDDEVSDVLARLMANEQFIALFAGLTLPRMHKIFPPLAAYFTRRGLKKLVHNLVTVSDVQLRMVDYVEDMMARAVDNFSCSGIQSLDNDKAHLFISNHRDIALDPAFLNYGLFKEQLSTVRIAIGDNLLEQEFVGEMMRLNKSFIVKRQVKKPRELLLSLRQLSSYIRSSLNDDRQSVWIAQREGRAKEGLDVTEPAILKMLAMSAGKGVSLADSLNALNIVPVAISYEYDPCDVMKAQELYALHETGGYQKSVGEDVESIYLGIKGFKGNVHLSVGDVFRANSDDPVEIASQFDEKIINAYVLHPSNFFAYQALYGECPALPCGADQEVFNELNYQPQREFFEARVKACPAEYRRYMLDAYANPLKSKLSFS